MKREPVFLILDSNVLLHFKPLAEIRWQEVVEADSIILVIPYVVTRELDKLRENHRLPKMRNRIRDIVSRHRKITQTPGPWMIRPEVELRLEFRDAQLNWTEHEDLDRTLDDDRVLAVALSYRSKGHSVALVTHDFGPELKAKHLGIGTLRLPDDLRLPEVIDESERELRRVRAELEATRNARPKIELCFANQQDTVQLRVPTPIQISEQGIDRAVEIEGNRIPVEAYYEVSELNILERNTFAAALLQPARPSQADVDQFNREREQYLDRYRAYLRAYAIWSSSRSLLHRLEVVVVNSGLVRGDDIDITITAHNLRFMNPDDQVQAPAKPEPPRLKKPRTLLEALGATSSATFPAERWATLADVLTAHPVDQDEPSMSYDRNGRTWSIHLPGLKQGMVLEFDVLLQRPVHEWVIPEDLTFSVTVGNGMGTQSGRLRVQFG